MMFAVVILARIFNILRSAASPGQIAGGFVIGMTAGLNPSLVISFLAIIILFVVDVNLAAGLLAIALFGLIAYLPDPLFHSLGYFLLAGLPPLEPLWTSLYNVPFIPLTNFNNTVVMGSFASALLLLPPVYFATKRITSIYRRRYDARVRDSKIARFIRSTIVYSWYIRIKEIGDRLW